MNNIISSSIVKIATCTYIAKLETTFDLQAIFTYIKLDENIKGVKFNNKIRGDMKTTGSFFNQLTVKIFIDFLDKETNLKIFPNGNFQISGVKNNNQACHSIKIFLEKIVNIKGEYTENVIVEDGIIYNKNDYIKLHEHKSKFDRFNSIKIYKKNNELFSFLGEKKNNLKFIINKNYVYFCDINKWFVEISHINFIKNIYDVNGNHIGYYEYIMKYKRKNLILHDCKFILKENETNIHEIVNKYKQVIGERHFIKNNVERTYNKEISSINLYYDGITNQDIKNSVISKDLFKSDFISKINLQITNINSNFAFDLKGHMLNKSNVHNIISEKYNVLSYYKPDSKYQAINIRMYFDENYNLTDINNKYIHRFTTTIFQNGKIMISGCKNKSHIVTVKKKLIEIFTENYDDFIIKQNKDIIINNEELSIWDVI